MGITTSTLLRLAFTLLLLGSGGAVAAPVTDESAYAPSGWATLHQSGANRRAQPIDLPTRFSSWQALAGASVLTSPIVGPEGNVYVTTGLPRGHANLYAFTLDGKPLWQTAPWQNKNDFDACAILSSPIADRNGDIYISDCNQLWAFKPDGRTKWVIDLPPPPPDAPLQQRDLPVNAFTTAVFTRDGDVLGVTNFGQVVVVDRATGSLRADIFQVPGLIPAPSTKYKLSAGIFGQNLMEPSLREWAWQLMLGGDMPSANTPAVAADGRIFVAATSTEPGLGALYALDLLPQADGKLRIAIAFASNMGPGSGSSPSLSPDEKQVYVSDERGMFYAFDTHGGDQIWQVQTDAAAAAAAVAPDGTIIALQEGDAFDVAIAPDGRRLWESNIDTLIKQALPRRWYLGGPIAKSTGNPVVVRGMVLSPVLYCYTLGWGGWQIPLPIRSMLVAIDLRNGRGIKNILELPDDSSGVTAVLPDGTIINSLGAVLTSATQPLLRFTRWLLPNDTLQLTARGGIHIARPGQAAAQTGAR